MKGQKELYELFEKLGIDFEYHEHPPAPDAETAGIYWKDIDAVKCKNLFFRNHKGNRHYLVILEHSRNLAIRDMEQKLKQGKLTMASEKRLRKYLDLEPGSVSPFGLINDSEQHVYVFVDEELKSADRLIFHPNVNTASIVLGFDDFIRFLEQVGNSFEFLKVY